MSLCFGGSGVFGDGMGWDGMGWGVRYNSLKHNHTSSNLLVVGRGAQVG